MANCPLALFFTNKGLNERNYLLISVKVMSERTRLGFQLAELTYTHTLAIESTHKLRLGKLCRHPNRLRLQIGTPVWFFQTLPLKILCAHIMLDFSSAPSTP